MTTQELIAELSQYPPETPCNIMDYRKNLGDDDGSGSFAGIYSHISVEYHHLEKDEREFYEEQNNRPYVPWVSISFANEDFDDNGNRIGE